MKTLNNKWTSLFLGVMLGFSLLQSVPLIFAQENDDLPADPPEVVAAEDSLCIDQMAPYFLEERGKFFQFIEKTFGTTLANSELVETAITEYGNYRNRLYKKFTEVSFHKGSEKLNLVQRVGELAQCQKRIKDEYRLAEETMKKYIHGTTNTKRTTALLEKLQAINGKLEGLNTNIGEMRGYFQIMANKVPYFVQKCVKQ